MRDEKNEKAGKEAKAPRGNQGEHRGAVKAEKRPEKRLETRPEKKAVHTPKVGKENTAEKKENRSGGKRDVSGEKRDVSSCKALKRCGACLGFAGGYEKQLEEKRQQVGKLLGGFGSISPVLGMENPYFYRNKVHRVFGRDNRGHDIYGNYEEGSHRIVSVGECLIEDKLSQAVIDTVFSLLPSFKLRAYDEDLEWGFLRHVLVRRAFATGQLMVVLVTASSMFPGKNNFVKALRAAHPEITTIVQSINDKRTNMILGEREVVLYGKGTIEDELCGCRFRISPASFYQVNHDQTEVLYGKAVELARLTGKETVLDAYCGIGTIGIVAAKHAGKVFGVENNPAAIRDARLNARENGFSNLEFVCGDAGEYMQEMASRGEPLDVVFMDPPRAGSDKNFLEALLTLSPKRVVYVSCNPETLARDLRVLTREYQVEKMIPVDMFPATKHVETVVLMSKGK